MPDIFQDNKSITEVIIEGATNIACKQILQINDHDSTQLRSQTLSIRLDDESRFGTPLG